MISYWLAETSRRQGGCPFPRRKNWTWSLTLPQDHSEIQPSTLHLSLRDRGVGPQEAAAPPWQLFWLWSLPTYHILTWIILCQYYKYLSENEKFNPWAYSGLFTIAATQRATHFLPARCLCILWFHSLKHLKSCNQRWKRWFRGDSGVRNTPSSAGSLANGPPAQLPLLHPPPNPSCLPPPNLSPAYWIFYLRLFPSYSRSCLPTQLG